MQHFFSKEFKMISNKIVEENKSLEEWAGEESDDMFQEGNYEGGFDATEMEFCFSVLINNEEFWFQLSFEDLKKINSNKLLFIEVVKADY